MEKPQGKDAVINFRTNPERKRLIEQTARLRGMTTTDFIIEALNLLSGFHPDFWQIIKARSQRSGILPSIIIQNTIARRMADDMAHTEVYGPSPTVLPELIFTEDGPVPFPELLENLKQNAVNRFKREKAELEK